MDNMISKMSRMYPWMILMGFMIVIAAFVIGYFNAQTAAAYFAETKAVRETTLTAQRASIESTGLWLPYFKFLGIGLILGGIIMALRRIIDNLKAAGAEVLSNFPPEKRPSMPKTPWYALSMPMLMMLGEVIFIVALIFGVRIAGIARAVFANPIPEIDAAGAGSALLSQVQTIHATSSWLVPLKFFGVATEFLAIAAGLATIVFILDAQTKLIDRSIQRAQPAKGEPAETKVSQRSGNLATGSAAD